MSLSGIAWRLYRGASLLTDEGVSPSMSFIASKKLRLINKGYYGLLVKLTKLR